MAILVCSATPEPYIMAMFLNWLFFTSHQKGRALWFIKILTPPKKWVPFKNTPKSGTRDPVVFFRDSKRGICNVYSMYTKTFKVRKQMG
jgi:hypothetical protein